MPRRPLKPIKKGLQMNNFVPTFIDSHIHLDHMEEDNPKEIEWLKNNGCVAVSWALSLNLESLQDLKHYLKAQARLIQKLNKNGLPCYFLTGIHPRNILPQIKVQDVENILAPFLESPYCLGLGEIGLETGHSKEKVIFAEQLALASKLRSKGIRIGIHTPRNNKVEITFEILRILNSYPGLEEITVIDHCTLENIGYVLKAGYWAGITLSPAKTSFQELEKIINRYPDKLHKIMCNTDSGTSFYDDLFRLLKLSDQVPFSQKNIRCLTWDNALQFFNLELTRKLK
jgi:uncharacterized protein